MSVKKNPVILSYEESPERGERCTVKVSIFWVVQNTMKDFLFINILVYLFRELSFPKFLNGMNLTL